MGQFYYSGIFYLPLTSLFIYSQCFDNLYLLFFGIRVYNEKITAFLVMLFAILTYR
jgi:hypothetical protein